MIFLTKILFCYSRLKHVDFRKKVSIVFRVRTKRSKRSKNDSYVANPFQTYQAMKFMQFVVALKTYFCVDYMSHFYSKTSVEELLECSTKMVDEASAVRELFAAINQLLPYKPIEIHWPFWLCTCNGLVFLYMMVFLMHKLAMFLKFRTICLPIIGFLV